MTTATVPHTFETSDLYEAAYLGYNEFALVELHVNEATAERHVVFTFGGDREEIRSTARAYFSGTALVNLKEYRFHLEQLKDRMFKALRKRRGNVQSPDRSAKAEGTVSPQDPPIGFSCAARPRKKKQNGCPEGHRPFGLSGALRHPVNACKGGGRA